LKLRRRPENFAGFETQITIISLFFALWNALRWLLGKAIIGPTTF